MKFKIIQLFSHDGRLLAKSKILLPSSFAKKTRTQENYNYVEKKHKPDQGFINLLGTKVLNENFNCNRTTILNEGGARSSKSYSIAQLLIYRFFSETNKKFLITRKTMRSLKISTFLTFVEILQKHELFELVEFNKSMFEFRYRSNYLLMSGMDVATKVQSTDFNYIWMEEAEEFTVEDYFTLKTRLSSPQDAGMKNQIFLSYNPKKKFGYINKIVKNETDLEVIKSSYKDNIHLKETYGELLENIKTSSPEYYKIFALGEYSSEEEQVYNHIQIVKEFPIEEAEERIFGLDFGFIKPTALIEILIKDGSYYVTELIYQRGLTNSQLIKKMKQLDILPDEVIYCDSSEPARRKELRSSGFNVKLANKDVTNGLDFLKSVPIYSLFTNDNLNNEIESYSYKKDRFQNLTEIPEKQNDHLMDAMRYAIFTHSKRSNPNIRVFTQTSR